jgi:hypothetical protein
MEYTCPTPKERIKMGLDMYLEARIYVSGYSWDAAEKQDRVDTIFSALDFSRSDFERPSLTVALPVGYWRKANQIHNWIVKNVQDDVDNCGEYYFSEEKRQELKEACEKVIEDVSLASELLPTSSGFFFGSTDYDEYYLEELQATVDILNRCQKDSKLAEASFYYSSSW